MIALLKLSLAILWKRHNEKILLISEINVQGEGANDAKTTLKIKKNIT